MLANALIPLAAPIIRHASEGPSATPLLIELMLAGVIGLIFVTRKPLARRARAVKAALVARKAQRRLPRTSP